MNSLYYQRILFQWITMTIFISHAYAGLNFPNSPTDLELGDSGFIRNLEKRGWNPKQLASEFDTRNTIEKGKNEERDEDIIELMRMYPELLQMHIDSVNMGKRGFNPNGYTRFIQMLRRRTGTGYKEEHGKIRRNPNRIDYTQTRPFKSQIKTYFKFRTKNEHPYMNFKKRGFNTNSYTITNKREREDDDFMEFKDEDERSDNMDETRKQTIKGLMRNYIDFLASNRFRYI